ncbi:Metallo-dependent phosphatase-like protein [Talaromyces proteolyticus]|uniref:Metallo-dependent phosphatase-like protein n=1 Tax=Talaromyces proteolyticus TaxID=1131652 RepID=A0AAD4PU76_9EURO|nr:Metallo-dependent phosphatase-like protein [Talaromyces proteolyticus]KAH8689015.1 Metallo-dependent phosphatase-like protein [Talaromyces proteolyticus]
MHWVILGLFLGRCASGLSVPKPLRFTSSGTFQIAVFSDLHYGEAEDLDWGPEQDINSTRVMNAILDVEEPQLIVLNGDLITGENTYKQNSSSYLDRIVEPLVERGLSWASTYGNHDSQFNLSRQDIFWREKRYRNSLTQSMVWTETSGVSNYFLPVYSSDERDPVPKAILWFFDSRGGVKYQQTDDRGNTVAISDFVDESVVNWFTTTNEVLTRLYRKTIPSLAFVHIPTTAMLAFQQETGVDKNREPGINDDYPLAAQGPSDGSFNYTDQDMPFMKALASTGGLIASFSGHDHGDDWCFKWDKRLPGMDVAGNGVILCFDRHSGYGGYGTWTRGSRQILLDEKTLGSQTKSWVRLEDSTISGAVTLNATYGQDKYPAVLDTFT